MRKKFHTEVYKELSKEFNLPIDVIEEICDSQFEFTTKVIREGKDQQVRLQFLGVFKVKEGRREIIDARSKKMKELHAKKQREL